MTTITGEHFSRVSVPEAIIAAVLAAGVVIVTVAPRRARAVALGTVGFAVLGVLAGLGFALTSSPHLAADLAYHLSVLVVLLAALLALARPGSSGARWVRRQRRQHGSPLRHKVHKTIRRTILLYRI